MKPSKFNLLYRQVSSVPWPDADFSGKVVMVTGANVGLGLEAARHFVRLNAAKVIIGCRSLEKAEAAKKDIESSQDRHGVVESWHVDLSSFESVQKFCRRADQLDRLDVVVENAAVAHLKHDLSEGYETQVTVNVLSTFLMALMLLPVLRRTATKYSTLPHMSVVSSYGHYMRPGQNMINSPILEHFKGDHDMMNRYIDTKLMVTLLVPEMAARMGNDPGLVFNMLEPGLCNTELFRHVPWPVNYVFNGVTAAVARTPEMGSRTLVQAGVAGPKTHGKYLSACEVIDPSPFVMSEVGSQAAKKMCDELFELLGRVEPGVSKNISA